MGRGSNRRRRVHAASSMAVLVLSGCGAATTTTVPGTVPTAVYTPRDMTAGPPARVSTRDRPPTHDPSAPCSAAKAEAGIELVQPCTVLVRRGATVPVLLRTPYPNMEHWRMPEIVGTSVRVGNVNITRNGNARFVLTGVRPGSTVITASVPGPLDAPGFSLTFTATVR